MTTGQWVLLIAVVAAVAFGMWRAKTDGRFRGARTTAYQPGTSSAAEEPSDTSYDVAAEPADPETTSVVAGTPYADQLGARATLLQFSSAFCAPCRATRRTLEEVTGMVGDVAHVEVDAESQLELVRRVGITRTPTTLVLDAHGREVTRAAGAPTRQQVLGALALVDAQPEPE